MTPRRKNDEDEERGQPRASSARAQPREDELETDEVADERRALLDAVASGLEDVLPGLELLDRDLVFDEGGRADLACLDESGRLVLVLLAEGDVSNIALVALDTASFANRHFDLLRRHLGSPTALRGGTRLVLLAPNGGDLLLRRVAPLCEIGLEVFGLRSITSAKGERSYLVRLGAGGEDASTRVSRLDSFLGRLPEATRAACRSVVERMRHIDDELVADVQPREIVWRAGGLALARLQANGSGVYGSVDPHEERVEISDEASADRLLEEVMESLIGVPALPAPRIVEDAEHPPLELSLDEPLLSAEELRAFRD
ncbi:MAG: hypothetical protein WD226_11360 [Planctomycetota bacterium]